MKRATTLLFVLLGTLPLGACGSTSKSLVTTIDDLASDTDREGRYRAAQNRIVSLTGTLSPFRPGQVYRYKPSRAVSTMFGLTNGNSYNEVLTILPSHTSTRDTPTEIVVEVKKKLRAAQLAGTAFVSAKIRSAEAERKLEELEKDAERTTRAALVSKLEDANAELETARRQLTEKTTLASESVNQPGVVVFRWATESKRNLSLASLLGFKSRQETASSGYTVAVGWRESTLVVGSDIHKLSVADNKNWEWFVLAWGWLPWIGQWTPDKYRQVTTRTIQSQAIAYLQDVSIAKSLEANLEASIEDLGSASKALDAADSIEIQAALSQVKSLTTEGVFGRATRSTEAVHFGPAPLNPEEKEVGAEDQELQRTEEGKECSDWLTLLSVEVDLQDLQEMFKDPNAAPPE